MEERDKRPFHDAMPPKLLFDRDNRAVVMCGHTWPHMSMFGYVRNYSQLWKLTTLGLDGVE